MTASKQLGLAGAALMTLSVGAAYLATLVGLQGHMSGPWGLHYLALGIVAALTVLVLVTFARGVSRSLDRMSRQMDAMADTGEFGLVLVEPGGQTARLARAVNHLLTAVKTQQEKLRSENRELQIHSRIAAAEKHHIEAIIFSISDAVIVTNRFDELILANDTAEKLLDFKLAPSLRKNIDRVIADATLVRLIRETRAHGRSFTRKVVEHSFDHTGSPRIYNVTLSCVETDNEEVSGVVAVLHDVTRDKEIARMKTDFVSNVSHELKTPLASIKAYIEMLNDDEVEDDKTRKEFYGIISSETERLHRLIENILNISRIESGVVKVVREPMSLTAVVRQVLDVAAPQAKAKDIEVVDQLAPIYYQVEADCDMIYQAVMNLVSNAIKYTPDGGRITVTVRADERRNLAICDVADTGAGIPPDDLPHIFDKFYRVKSNQKMAKGTGLGLALVKHMVETVHEGKLSVTSEQGRGSTFSMQLPLLIEEGK